MVKKTWKRALSSLIAVLLLATLVPASALAANDDYKDVSADADYAIAVAYLKEQGYMVGTGGNKFSPDQTLTRGMAATVLYRMAGEPAVAGDAGFPDVADGKYYTKAVAWAAEKGIMIGGSEGSFAPDKIISGAEVNLVISRYASNIIGTTVSGSAADTDTVTRAQFALAIYNDILKDGIVYDLDIAKLMDGWQLVTELPKSQKGALVYDDNGNLVMTSVQPCYALYDVIYCATPADAQVQQLDIYVPVEYMTAVDNGDGTYTCTPKADGVFTRADGVTYTAATAPVIYQNTVDGYKQGDALVLTSGRKGANVGEYNSYLTSGYVLVSIGTRGIDSTADGTAPAAVVDLKAGIRYLKANADYLPGDMGKIVATGTSAGGAVTAALGASGNSKLFDSYLEEIGAIMDSADDIYAAMPFCPITNLDHGDAAFAWLHASETSYSGFGGGGMGGGPGGGGPGGGMGGGPGGGGMGGGSSSSPTKLDEFEVAVHEALIAAYEADLVSFGLDPDAFAQAYLDCINACIADYVEKYVDDVDAFAAENPVLKYEDGKLYCDDMAAFIAKYMPRKKGADAFDSFEASATENKLFDGKHFSAEMAAVLESLADEYPKAAELAAASQAALTAERINEVAMMSTLTYVLGESESDIAPFWRFRNGTNDGDLGAISAFTLTELLNAKGLAQAEFALVWGVGHMSADYSYVDVQTYVDSICK